MYNKEKEITNNDLLDAIKKHNANNSWRFAMLLGAGALAWIVSQMDIGATARRTREMYEKQPQEYEIQVNDIIGGDAPEKFYHIQGRRVYLEIDGKSIEDYVEGK